MSRIKSCTIIATVYLQKNVTNAENYEKNFAMFFHKFFNLINFTFLAKCHTCFEWNKAEFFFETFKRWNEIVVLHIRVYLLLSEYSEQFQMPLTVFFFFVILRTLTWTKICNRFFTAHNRTKTAVACLTKIDFWYS